MAGSGDVAAGAGSVAATPDSARGCRERLSSGGHGARSRRSDAGTPRQLQQAPASEQSQAGAPASGGSVRVRVAARVRPLLALESPCSPGDAADGRGASCVEVSGNAIAIGKSCFLFDKVFGPDATQEEVYAEYVEPLVDAIYEGVHGTLLAYGQTGSGKTYTMGTSGLPSVPPGALQLALTAIFARARRASEADGRPRFRATYVEIFTDASRAGGTEEIRDLLDPAAARAGAGSQALASIRVDLEGQMRLEGVSEHEVTEENDVLALLRAGSAMRATGATRMNETSSRSHAIFSLEVVQQKILADAPCTLTAKFQFVDLAGSEKVKQSGVEGELLSQAININHGLFVLGKVISALTDGQLHVPFRESKLTRLLQNSLGGNSRTSMIACVSPSSKNLAESISTLTYAAKAKEIRNKPVVNRGSSCPSCAALQTRLAVLEAKLAAVASDPGKMAALAPGQQQQQRLEDLRAADKSGHEKSLEESDLQKSSRRMSTRLAVSPSQEDGAALAAAEARAVKAEALFRRCSERLAALQHLGAAGASLEGDRGNDDEEAIEDEACDDEVDANAEDPELSLLDQDAGRKQRLLLQAEDNHQTMATLEAQAMARITKQEAARDIAERELSRLKVELELARSREEQFSSLQERYDQRLAALQERNAAMERERKEMQRLRTLQRKQEVRLQVLQDSIRKIKNDRERLQGTLDDEVQRRKDQENLVKKERSAARETIRNLTVRLRNLARSGGAPSSKTRNSLGPRDVKANTPERSSTIDSPDRHPAKQVAEGSGCRNVANSENAAAAAAAAAGEMLWKELLDASEVRSLRHRQLAQVQADVEELSAQCLVIASNRERLLVEVELVAEEHPKSESDLGKDMVPKESGDGSDVAGALALLEQEAKVLADALEYKRAEVWMRQRDLAACPDRDVAEAARLLAADLGAGDAAARGLAWLAAEAAARREEAAAAREARAVTEAELAAATMALRESRQRAAQQEQSFDAARGEYESRIASVLGLCLPADGSRETPRREPLESSLREDALRLLTRRVEELEEELRRERREKQERGQRKVGHDLELIANCRRVESENVALRGQVQESTARAERAVERAAKREAQLLERISQLESQHQPAAGAPCAGSSAGAGASWDLALLEDVCQAVGSSDFLEDFRESLRADVEVLCRHKLQEHREWKRELEGRVEALRVELTTLCRELGEEEDAVPQDDHTSLLQVAKQLEVSSSSLKALKRERGRELLAAAAEIEDIFRRLHEASADPPVPSPEDPGSLRLQSIAEVQKRLEDLKSVRDERQLVVSSAMDRLQDLWDTLGLRIPDDLDVQELPLLEGPPCISDQRLAYIDVRSAHLSAWICDLEVEKTRWQAEFDEWSRSMARFALPATEVPPGLPLLRAVEALQSAAKQTEAEAGCFLRGEQAALVSFYDTSRLPNVAAAAEALGSAPTLAEALNELARHWERLGAQRQEHGRIAELVAARERLQADMRDFDAETSDPNRFKRRGYSGVVENKRRTEYQRQLRLLDSALGASTADWAQREGVPFCLDGVEYRGSELLPSEHTHMYAWTGRQLARHSQEEEDRRSRTAAAAAVASAASAAVPGATEGAGAVAGGAPTPRHARPHTASTNVADASPSASSATGPSAAQGSFRPGPRVRASTGGGVAAPTSRSSSRTLRRRSMG